MGIDGLDLSLVRGCSRNSSRLLASEIAYSMVGLREASWERVVVGELGLGWWCWKLLVWVDGGDEGER